MIPTRIKSKIPKTLSWPLGAEAISAELGDSPHAEECTLWFSNSQVLRASEFQQILREDRPFAVLVAEYTPALNAPYSRSKERDAAGFYDAKWVIRINPVPRAWRANVSALLREQGLPAVAEWLRRFKGNGWQAQCHRLELVFAPLDGTLTRKPFEGV